MNEYEQLKHLYNYIKKTINTPLKESTLKEKSKNCKDIYTNLQIEFGENSVDEIFINNSKRWYLEINQIIKAKLDKLKTKNQLAITSISMVVKTTTLSLMSGEECKSLLKNVNMTKSQVVITQLTGKMKVKVSFCGTYCESLWPFRGQFTRGWIVYRLSRDECQDALKNRMIIAPGPKRG